MKNNSLIGAVFISALLTVVGIGGVNRFAYADDSEAIPDASALQSRIDDLQKQITELSTQLTQLNQQQGDLQKREKEKVQSKFPVKLSGNLQVLGSTRFSESGPASSAHDTFRLRRGQIKLQGQITPRISATAMFDVAKSSVILQDLYLTYLLREGKNKKNAHYVDVGQLKLPVGYESTLSASALPFVERSLLSQLKDPLKAPYETARDTGIQVRGSVDKFDYRFGIFNGWGETQNALANSDAKAIIGRLAYNVTPEWQVGASYARGNTGVDATGVRADRDLWNLFTAYKKNKLSLQGEYSQGDYNDPINGQQDIRGYYGNIGYFLTPKLEGVARADFFDYKNLNAAIKQYTLGLNYYLKGNNAKIQLNLVHTDGNPAAPGIAFDNNSNELRTLFQVAF